MLIVISDHSNVSQAAEKPLEQVKNQRQFEAPAKKEAPIAKKEPKQLTEEELARIKLPEDTTPRLKVKELRFSGNTLVTTTELLADLPIIFNASDKPITKAESQNLYDFRPLHEVISTPEQTVEVSARTLQGLTQYVLSVYQQKNYGGIYVYVPAEILSGGEVKDGIVVIDVIESQVSSVGIKYYDPNQKSVEKGHLDPNAVLGWSPVKPQGYVNQKKLDDFLNLLNLNPDRYVSAVVSKGSKPNTLAVNYDIYEVNPWHYFIQIDNSGVDESQWNPKIGIVNTNLLGFDDQFTAVYQFRPDSTWNDNYSLYGSYDFPIAGQGLRLNIYGGYSEFDLSSQTSDISFIGGGKFIGANLRYNVFQVDDWFFDVIGSFSEEESRNTPSIFPEFLASKVRMTLLGGGVDIHKRDDMYLASLGYKYTANVDGSDRSEYLTARANSDKYFKIHDFYGSYSQVLDPNIVTKLSTSLRWIITNDRLVPAKMTPFGGMYSVRGYEEYEILADGGLLASAQYEFDLVRYEKLKEFSKEQVDKEQAKQQGLKKFAPLVFTDYGWSKINDASSTINEKSHETLWSAGVGALAEYGNNLSAAVYYGIAMRDTENTDAGDGRVSVSFMLRW
jgi:hemolysin activation/secretion protein